MQDIWQQAENNMIIARVVWFLFLAIIIGIVIWAYRYKSLQSKEQYQQQNEAQSEYDYRLALAKLNSNPANTQIKADVDMAKKLYRGMLLERVDSRTADYLVEKLTNEILPVPNMLPSSADELQKFAKLFADGVITQAEFDEAKRKILAA